MSYEGRFGRYCDDPSYHILDRARSNIDNLRRWKPSPEDSFSNSFDTYENGINLRTGELVAANALRSIPEVQSVDYHIEANTVKHHTEKYHTTKREDSPQLVVRRGQQFKLTIKLNKPYNKDSDDLRMVFEIGLSPSVIKETRVRLILSDKDMSKEWGAKLVDQDKENLTLTISTPPDCKVGEWKFKVEVIKKKNRDASGVFRSTDGNSIYILFNPWNEDDQVFHPDQQLLEEYVSEELGIIYRGTRKIHGIPKDWNYGQFQENILECALFLLNNSRLKMEARGDPVKIVRKLSAVTNVQDDQGILVGNWSGNYEGGNKPTSWNGSVDILQQYYDSKVPVKYGQCWVFAGILTTLCRTLGIPTRTISNFSSAHDSDGSTTLDRYYDLKEKKLELNTYMSESVWNYHCWNDVWMARPKLPEGFGGWQAIDATPQETSEGIYQCGPSPLRAIKNGEILMPCDTGFIFAEVNADIIKWARDEGEWVKSNVDTKSVGKKILTKMPFVNDPEDITNQYKYPEDSPEERASKIQANQKSTEPQILTSGEKVLEFELDQEEPSYYGANFDVRLKISNKSEKARTVGGIINIYSIYYTGILGDKIKSHEFKDLEVQKESEEYITISASIEDYDDKLVEYCHIETSYLCTVQEVDQFYAGSDSFLLQKPELTMKVPSEVKVFEFYNVEVSFTNPLDKTLTNCKLNLESPNLQRSLKIDIRNVKAKETYMMSVPLYAGYKPGSRTIIANFDSKELVDITGRCKVKIIE